MQPFECPQPRAQQAFGLFLDVFVKNEASPCQMRSKLQNRAKPAAVAGSQQPAAGGGRWAVGPMNQIWSGGKRARRVGPFDVGEWWASLKANSGRPIGGLIEVVGCNDLLHCPRDCHLRLPSRHHASMYG